MTPGAGTAQSVGRVWRRQMWRVAAGSWFCIGRFAALRWSSGRHKWRSHVCGRSNVVLCRPVRGVARRGAIHDARCRNGTICRPRWVSADVAGRRPVRGFVLAGSRHCVGYPGVTSGVRAFAGRSTVVLRRSVRGIASVIRASRVAPLRLGVVECCFASVVRASQVAPLRLRRLNVVFVSAGLWFCVGHPGVTSGAPTFAGRSTVVLRQSVRGVARRGAIHDARCRNGTIRQPCGFFEPSGKGGLHSGGCPKILCFQIVVPHVCITFAA